MRYRLLLLLTAIVALAAGTLTLASFHRRSLRETALAAIVARPLQIEDEEYAVYSVMINSNLKSDAELEQSGEPKDRVLILNDQPTLWDGFIADENEKFFEELKKSSPDLEPETVNDLRVKSNETYRLARKLSIKIKYTLVSSEEIESLFKEGVGGGWEAFHKKYPKSSGIMTVSRVGFNSAKTQALVYSGWSCGGLCGGGGYTLLTKKNGVWTVKGSIGPTWVS